MNKVNTKKKMRWDEKRAAMAWTRLAEGEDEAAVSLVRERGYVDALEMVGFYANGKNLPQESRISSAMKRWCMRYDEKMFAHDASDTRVGFLMPTDSHWPKRLEHLGNSCPLGLWFQGNDELLARPSVGIVGSRDSSSYGAGIASRMSFDFAYHGAAVVSGGAIGIDTVAHRGALAADGYTTVVLAGGVDRFYPATNREMFLEIIDSGGALCSEHPPGSAPHRHRFLARNRIIAALVRGLVVVEAPFRSGALSTAHHAMSIGHPVGAVPGPVDSPRSSGCHRLLREGAVCVTNFQEAKELLGFDGSGSQEGFCLEENDPLMLRVRDALSFNRWLSAGRIAEVAGLSISETLAGLGMLEGLGRAKSDGVRWRLIKA